MLLLLLQNRSGLESAEPIAATFTGGADDDRFQRTRLRNQKNLMLILSILVQEDIL